MSTMCIKEPEAALPCEMEGRRGKEGRRGLDMDRRRCGDLGAGDPGWTREAQAIILE